MNHKSSWFSYHCKAKVQHKQKTEYNTICIVHAGDTPVFVRYIQVMLMVVNTIKQIHAP